MVIYPKIEEPTREMLGHAIQGELSELSAKIDAVGDEIYGTGIALCLIAAGYIAVDLSERWPTDADIREIARHTAESSTDYELWRQDVYDFLARGALGFQPMGEVFPDPNSDYKLPVLITAQMLIAFNRNGMRVWDYLDTVWNAVEAAEHADLSLLPALVLRSRQGHQGSVSPRTGTRLKSTFCGWPLISRSAIRSLARAKSGRMRVCARTTTTFQPSPQYRTPRFPLSSTRSLPRAASRSRSPSRGSCAIGTVSSQALTWPTAWRQRTAGISKPSAAPAVRTWMSRSPAVTGMSRSSSPWLSAATS
jgi:hypothetical protein